MKIISIFIQFYYNIFSLNSWINYYKVEVMEIEHKQ